ncbi:hypothetical protein B0J14DRAFT_704386 [Halenospora varia]|nr:hypothetical protein B0J14DRAFT_704386 [Halenospora varia]
MPLLHFHLFGALPLELRCEIWTLSLPSPRSILPFRDDEFTQYERHPVIENPIALRVCQESRVVAIRYYRTWTNAEALGYQYVDFTNDSIIFESEAFDLPGLEMRHMNRISMSTLLLPKIDRERIEKVELRVFGPDAHQ